jgi:hypothetical protein
MVRLTVTLRPSVRSVQELVEAFRFLMVRTRRARMPRVFGVDGAGLSARRVVIEEDIRRRVVSDCFVGVSLIDRSASPCTCSSTSSIPRAA